MNESNASAYAFIFFSEKKNTFYLDTGKQKKIRKGIFLRFVLPDDKMWRLICRKEATFFLTSYIGCFHTYDSIVLQMIASRLITFFFIETDMMPCDSIMKI